MKKLIMAALAASLVMPAPVLANDSELITPDPEQPVLVQSPLRAAAAGDEDGLTKLYLDYQCDGTRVGEEQIAFRNDGEEIDLSHYVSWIPDGYHFVEKQGRVMLSKFNKIDRYGEECWHIIIPVQKLADSVLSNLDFNAEARIVLDYKHPENEYEQSMIVSSFFGHENENADMILSADEISKLFLPQGLKTRQSLSIDDLTPVCYGKENYGVAFYKPKAGRIVLEKVAVSEMLDREVDVNVGPYMISVPLRTLNPDGKETFDLSLDAQKAILDRFKADYPYDYLLSAEPEEELKNISAYEQYIDLPVKKLTIYPQRNNKIRLSFAGADREILVSAETELSTLEPNDYDGLIYIGEMKAFLKKYYPALEIDETNYEILNFTGPDEGMTGLFDERPISRNVLVNAQPLSKLYEEDRIVRFVDNSSRKTLKQESYKWKDLFKDGKAEKQLNISQFNPEILPEGYELSGWVPVGLEDPDNDENQYSDHFLGYGFQPSVYGYKNFIVYVDESSEPGVVNNKDLRQARVNCPYQFDWTGEEIKPEPAVILGGKLLKKNHDYTLEYDDDTTSPGYKLITITAKGDYEGQNSASYKIEKKDLKNLGNCSIENLKPFYFENEMPSSLNDLKVTLNGKTLTKDTDYEIEIYTPEDDDVYVQIQAKDESDYHGYKDIYPKIVSKTKVIPEGKTDLSKAVISDVNESYELNDYIVDPTPTVILDGTTLVEGKDYRLEYSNNDRPGTAKLTVIGIGDYAGRVSKTFKLISINRIDLSSATVSGLKTSVEYTGKLAEQKDLTVKLDGKTLAQGIDYVVSFNDAVNAGTATLTITGQGAYKGTITKTFTITPAAIAAGKVEGPESVPISGQPATPDFTVTWNGQKLTKDTDYTITYSNNNKVGQAKATITGKGNFTGKIEKTFTIAQKSLEDASVELADGPFTFTGSAIQPEVTVTKDRKTLTKNTDYEVRYANNLNVGKAEVKVSGKGDYAGELKAEFTITPKTLDESDVVLSGLAGSYSYTGTAIVPEFSVTADGKELTKGTDFDVAAEKNTDVGLATVKITFKGNYSGNLDKSFTITPASIAGGQVSVDAEDLVYDGTAKEPEISVTYQGNIIDPSNYDVAYSKNVNAGTASITVKGKGNFTGELSGAFAIAQKQLNNAEFSSDQSVFEYTGEGLIPDFSVSVDGTTLAEGDYTVSVQDNIEPGIGRVTITGTGNYTGTAAFRFRIAPKDLSEAKVTNINESYALEGEAVTFEPTVILGDKTLEKGVDYDLLFFNNTSAGTGSILIQGKGRYKGTVEKEFTVQENLLDVKLLGLYPVCSEENSEQKPVVVAGGKTLTEGTDYSLVYTTSDFGETTVTVTGKGNFSGASTYTYRVAAEGEEPTVENDLRSDTVNVSGLEENQTITMNNGTFDTDLTVTAGEKTLVAGEDYEVIFTESDHAGPAKAYISGLGSWSGLIEIPFALQEDLAATDLTGIDNVYYVKDPTINPVVSVRGKKLIEELDYTIEKSIDAENKTGTLTITGKGAYTGTVTRTFAVRDTLDPVTDLSQATVTGLNASYAFNGSAVRPNLQVSLGNKVLKENEDYRLSFAGNDKVGTATVTIEGIGDYCGTITRTFEIRQGGTGGSGGSGGGAIGGSPVIPGQSEGVKMHRMYNPNSGEHFYTADENEKNTLVSLGWSYEDVAWNAPKSSDTPVYRLYNPNAGDHHFTKDKHEYEVLQSLGWKAEGIAWYCAGTGTPMHRLYNPNAKRGAHHYTANEAERDELIRLGWKHEGIGWYGL